MKFTLPIGFGVFLFLQGLNQPLPVLAHPSLALSGISAKSEQKAVSGNRLALQGYEITHQGDHILNLNVSYQWDAPQRILASPPNELQSFIEHFLVTYPNEDDYWEMVNRNLVIALSEAYPGLVNIIIKIDVEPCGQFPHRRGTVVEYSSGELHERWYFSMPLPEQARGTVTAPVVVAGNGLMGYPTRLVVDYDYRVSRVSRVSRVGEEGVYPDYNAVVESIQLSWATYKDFPHEQLLQLAVEAVEQAFPMLSAVTLQLR